MIAHKAMISELLAGSRAATCSDLATTCCILPQPTAAKACKMLGSCQPRALLQACLTRCWPKDDLHSSVPWLIRVLADLKDSHPAPAGRLKAAALQLLPPLLDGLHARRLSLDWEQFSYTLVCAGAAFHKLLYSTG